VSFQLKKDQIYDRIKADIKSGKLPDGEQLPRFTVLCEQFDVSMKTIRVAMEKLEKDGFIQRIHGRGTFVRNRCETKKFMVLLMHERPLENPENYILPGIETEAALRGIELERVYWEFLSHLSAKDIIEKFRSLNIAGILTAFHSFPKNSKINHILQGSGVPVVLLRASLKDCSDTDFATIRFERYKAYAEALKELFKRGHRRICYLGHRKIETRVSFEDMVEYSGLPEDSVRHCVAGLDDKDIHEGLEKIIKDWQPTAIFCFSDFFALKAYRTLNQMNLRIPGDISVMGAANFPGGRFLDPALSSIDFRFFESGSAGVKILERSSEWFKHGEAAPPELFLDWEMIWRDSVAKRLEADLLK
jgi:DNA-binding LacI/PurR family transcriptional regulator